MTNIDLKHFADSLVGPEDERKVTCINCKSKDYEIDFKDRICKKCQKKGITRRDVNRKEETIRHLDWLNGFFFLWLIAMILIFLYNPEKVTETIVLATIPPGLWVIYRFIRFLFPKFKGIRAELAKPIGYYQ